jgi:hypothetical protein
MLIAFNAAPDTVAPEGQGPYGPYAQALAEMIREGGLPLADVFERVRLRVNDVTKGAEVPWHASKVQAQYVFFERQPDAPAPAVSYEQTAAIRDTPIQDLGAQGAYVAALDRDTLQGYLDFLAAYPDDPMANRVRACFSSARGDHVAPNACRRYAGRLLVVPAPISARASRGGSVATALPSWPQRPSHRHRGKLGESPGLRAHSHQQSGAPTQQGTLPTPKGQPLPLVKGASPTATGQPQNHQSGRSLGQQPGAPTQQGALPATKGQTLPFTKGAPPSVAGQLQKQQSDQSSTHLPVHQFQREQRRQPLTPTKALLHRGSRTHNSLANF